MNILVTGSNGFIGKHLMEALSRRPSVEAIGYDLGTSDAILEEGLRRAGVIFHLAGVNRPQNVEEFKEGNANFTQTLCERLLSLGRTPLFVLSSSIQAALDNPYGISKRAAEQAVEDYANKCARLVSSDADLPAPRSPLFAAIFRLRNVFGKWCRPNYNSVTATFCHNIAHDLPISISDPSRELELVYIDDVIKAFLGTLESRGEQGVGSTEAGSLPPVPRLPSEITAPCSFPSVPRSFKTTLGEMAALIRSFRESRKSLLLPSLDDEFTKRLYATYLSYLEGPEFAYWLDPKTDPRGSLAEFVKSPTFGQIFVSRTRPGITRGNHYHHTKTEKFLVVEGEAVIRFRSVQGGVESGEQGAKREEQTTLSTPRSSIIEHRVSGREFKVVDIPPGYTHSIENVGAGELVTLFWASEIFDPAKPDTYFTPVQT